MLVFSSDFPHFEGIADPVAHYRVALAELPPEKRERFMGGTIEQVFARMGDALI
jgi:hypothetical protein